MSQLGVGDQAGLVAEGGWGRQLREFLKYFTIIVIGMLLGVWMRVDSFADWRTWIVQTSPVVGGNVRFGVSMLGLGAFSYVRFLHCLV
jgi:hypothetical protein